jgi:malate synthase
VTGGLYTAIRDDSLAALGGPTGGSGHLPEAAELLDRLVLDDEFAEFLTQRAYSLLD